MSDGSVGGVKGLLYLQVAWIAWLVVLPFVGHSFPIGTLAALAASMLTLGFLVQVARDRRASGAQPAAYVAASVTLVALLLHLLVLMPEPLHVAVGLWLATGVEIIASLALFVALSRVRRTVLSPLFYGLLVLHAEGSVVFTFHAHFHRIGWHPTRADWRSYLVLWQSFTVVMRVLEAAVLVIVLRAIDRSGPDDTELDRTGRATRRALVELAGGVVMISIGLAQAWVKYEAIEPYVKVGEFLVSIGWLVLGLASCGKGIFDLVVVRSENE